jgi:hypothetical protein
MPLFFLGRCWDGQVKAVGVKSGRRPSAKRPERALTSMPLPCGSPGWRASRAGTIPEAARSWSTDQNTATRGDAAFRGLIGVDGV